MPFGGRIGLALPCTEPSSSCVTRSSKPIVQPIYSLLLALGGGDPDRSSALLPFFTLGEDTVMFKAVGLDVILLLVLIATLFATSKSIYEEIEDRTMLTLMSKPVEQWEVLVGKYLGHHRWRRCWRWRSWARC